MIKTGEVIKVRKQISSIIITSFLILNFSISTPKIAAPPAPVPDQFIAEIFPNCTLPLQLIRTNTIITFNATDFSNKIGINFDANYTIYNSENTTAIPVIVPFSLAINITNIMCEVKANNSQIPYDLFSVSPWDENMTEIDVYFLPRFIDMYPIIFIRCNITLLKNSTLIIRYQFSGSISNPLDSKNIFFIVYYIGSSQDWIGNNSGRVELRVYGKQPVFSGGVYPVGNCYFLEINGGKTYICEWNNIQIPATYIGFKYETNWYTLMDALSTLGLIVINLLGYFTITIIVIKVIIRRKKHKKLKVM